jgi:hypothetical protein
VLNPLAPENDERPPLAFVKTVERLKTVNKLMVMQYEKSSCFCIPLASQKALSSRVSLRLDRADVTFETLTFSERRRA